MAGEAKVDAEIIYCVPWQHLGTAAWTANELFAQGGKDVSIKITPGVAGVFQVFLDGEKVFDRKEEGNIFPDLTRVKQMRAILQEKINSAPVAAD